MEPSDPLASLRSERPTTPLYHYTSPAGLLGIIESKALWASGIQYLNDTAEFKHAASIARDLLNRYLENENNPYTDLYRLLVRGGEIFLDATVFVCSLSEAKDRLSQWRAYCAAGGGFSIGFDAALVERQAKKQGFSYLNVNTIQTGKRTSAPHSFRLAAVMRSWRSSPIRKIVKQPKSNSKRLGFGMDSWSHSCELPQL